MSSAAREERVREDFIKTQTDAVRDIQAVLEGYLRDSGYDVSIVSQVADAMASKDTPRRARLTPEQRALVPELPAPIPAPVARDSGRVTRYTHAARLEPGSRYSRPYAGGKRVSEMSFEEWKAQREREVPIDVGARRTAKKEVEAYRAARTEPAGGRTVEKKVPTPAPVPVKAYVVPTEVNYGTAPVTYRPWREPRGGLIGWFMRFAEWIYYGREEPRLPPGYEMRYEPAARYVGGVDVYFLGKKLKTFNVETLVGETFSLKKSIRAARKFIRTHHKFSLDHGPQDA